jgi:hypothetical protein
MTCHSDLTQAVINQFVAHLFDKDPPTSWPDSVPKPYCSENPPPTVSITVFFFALLYTYD